MAWRSSSLMMLDESSIDRSVNSGTICGVVIRIIKKEKKPIRASVTAPMAAIRAAPSDFTKSKKPCTGLFPPAMDAECASHPARFAQFKVSVRLIPCGAHTKEIRGTERAGVHGRSGGESYWRY